MQFFLFIPAIPQVDSGAQRSRSRVGKSTNLRHSDVADLMNGDLFRGVTMPSLRLIAVALVVSGSAMTLGLGAVAEPLDKQNCASLQLERKKLLTREMQAALDRGPDWVKDHLNDQELEQVRRFLGVEEDIQFRCRGGGVVKRDTAGIPAQGDRTPSAADVVPLPDRKPAPPPETASDASQALADSAKTPPSKAKATR
jgi:hypothetical protein